jgi:hypothetical protein
MTKQKSTAELEAEWSKFTRPQDGQKFRHYKGGEYEIVATGFLEDSETPCVIYRSLLKNTVWVRTANNFLEDVEFEGRDQPRFRAI